MNAIVGVHGIWNFKRRLTPEEAAANLANRVWTPALARSLEGAGHAGPTPTVTVAYYADLLRRSDRQGASEDLEDLDPLEQEIALAWLTELGLPEAVPMGRSFIRVRQAATWLAQSRGLPEASVAWFTNRIAREVGAYLRDPDSPARKAARARVTDAVASSGARVVIAHSLGSIVAYEALWERPDLPIDLLITLGSPLALPGVVLPRLCPPPIDGMGARPPGVSRWVNLADPGDIVAIPPRGIGRAFANVDVDDHTEIGIFDFHFAKNYLAHPRVGQALISNWGQTTR
ncbi:hypothetical protein [Embleya hyalina]|uniref:Serine peptidase n=1 Tax=Embleya hyalina TaxID=516124 RepID=A0A401YYJ3_9ACTN|nr:hypothetical protein [Embleya hyalina]GCD99658.1 hypothetical protein EHYA_07380 [Embleya hyalina]